MITDEQIDELWDEIGGYYNLIPKLETLSVRHSIVGEHQNQRRKKMTDTKPYYVIRYDNGSYNLDDGYGVVNDL